MSTYERTSRQKMLAPGVGSGPSSNVLTRPKPQINAKSAEIPASAGMIHASSSVPSKENFAPCSTLDTTIGQTS